MKFKNETEFLVYQKNTYARMTSYYARLCELYSNLAALNPSVESAKEIMEMYSKPLSCIVAGDLETLRDLNFSKEEFSIFEKFEHFSKKFKYYQDLSESVRNGMESEEILNLLSKGQITDPTFFTTDSSSKEIQDYNNDMAKKTLNAIAFETSHTLRQAGKTIDRIDSNAIPNDRKLKQITPKSCGATISFPRTKHKSNHFHGNKDINRKKMVGFVAGLALLGIGGIKAVQHLQYSNLSATENEKNGYEHTVSDDTKSKLKNIDNAIFLVKKSRIEPSDDVMYDIVYNLDNVIDDVISDLVTDAFKEKHPNYEVVSVETSYDTSNSTSHNRVQENSCEITYINDKNEKEFVTLRNFDKDILNTFKDEYLLDHHYESLSIDDLQTICDNINHLAGTKVEYVVDNDTLNPDLKTYTPSKKSDTKKELQTAFEDDASKFVANTGDER